MHVLRSTITTNCNTLHLSFIFFFLLTPPPPPSPLFPYTPPFRSPRGPRRRVRRDPARIHPPILVSRVARCASNRKSTRLNSSHGYISYAVFCLKKKKKKTEALKEVTNCSKYHN